VASARLRILTAVHIPVQAEILRALEVEEPPRFLEMKPAVLT
jgi:hypothetical protein